MFTPSPSSVVLGSPWVISNITQGILGLALTLAWRSRSALAWCVSHPCRACFPLRFYYTAFSWNCQYVFQDFLNRVGKKPPSRRAATAVQSWPLAPAGGYAAPAQAPVTPSTTAKNKRRKFTVDNIRKPCYNVPTGKGGAL